MKKYLGMIQINIAIAMLHTAFLLLRFASESNYKDSPKLDPRK